MNDIAHARAALSASTDPLGQSELQGVLTRLEQAWATAYAPFQVAVQAGGGLTDLHTTLVYLRRSLEPFRETLLDYEDDVDALYWSRVVSQPGAATVLDVIRTYKHIVHELVLHLPRQRHALLPADPKGSDGSKPES